MKTAICDSRMEGTALLKLRDYCDRIVLLPSFSALAEPVSAHPDMLIFPCVKEKIIFTHGEYMPVAKALLCETEYDIIAISEKAGCEYPKDILLNAALVGNKLFGRLPYISSSVASFAEEKGLELIDTRQGYAKCSVCTVSDGAIITSDVSIAKAAKANGVEVLLISEGNVDLAGYDHGFIGGASGSDGENIFFCGDVEAHPDGEKIIDFCLKHKKRAVSLSGEKLYDVGTIFFV